MKQIYVSSSIHCFFEKLFSPYLEVKCPELVGDTYTCETDGLKPGSKATCTCNSGMKLTSGDLDRVCGDEGEWLGTEPVCEGELVF